MNVSAFPFMLIAGFALYAAPSLAGADLFFESGFEDCGAITTRACYGGPGGTQGIGICQAGTQHCENGGWGPCTSEVNPVFESCNGLDDDCDAGLDEGLGTISCGVGACQQTVSACGSGAVAVCTPGSPIAEICDGIDNDCDGAIDEDGCNCVHVSPTGLDTNPGTAANPKRTIAAAITAAATTGPAVVCVAVGVTCLSTTNYDEALTMQNGVHVYGGYQAVGDPWPRSATCVTRVRAQDGRGVYFGASVTAPTILDGFTITGGTLATNAAVTVQGSSGGIINNNVITGGAGTTSYGIDVIDEATAAATPVITRNSITGGTGSALTIGVRSLNSTPTLRANCDTFDASGRCTSSCTSSTGSRLIRGRSLGSTGTASYGVRLEASPGAVIDGNSICSYGTSTGDAAGVRLSGAANGTLIRANSISGNGAQNAVGVWADACAGAAPWLVNNSLIAALPASLNTRADGIRAQGDCHPRIDDNVRITGSGDSLNGDVNGIYCANDPGTGIASRCTISGNTAILGTIGGVPPNARGIRCDDGACAIIRDNLQISAAGGQNTVGLMLGKGGTLVDSNLIQAGCASVTGIGLRAIDSFARIQNNRIEGSTTGGSCSSLAPLSVAAWLTLGAGTNEVDLHSNDLIGQLGGGACDSWALVLDLATAPPFSARGLIRNNIMSAGACTTNIAIVELNVAADPRVLQNNDLWSPVAPTALYRDEGANNLITIATVNALGDVTAASNISADPLYTGENKLSSGSPARDTGLLTGAPAFDFEGAVRPQGPAFDIGRDEYYP